MQEKMSQNPSKHQGHLTKPLGGLNHRKLLKVILACKENNVRVRLDSTQYL